MPLFEVKQIDKDYYQNIIKDFIPDTIIDAHAHVFLKEFRISDVLPRATAWPNKISEDCSIEDLEKTNQLIFPGKKVVPVLFGQPHASFDMHKCNEYVKKTGSQHGYPTLFLSHPSMSSEELEKGVLSGGFKGTKVYLNFSPEYIPDSEIRIFDFLPHHHLEVLDRHGWVVMLHIPRPGRLKDPVNIAQLLEIEEKYQNVKLIVAHVGRAYAKSDVGDAFKKLANTKNMLFDFSANVNPEVFAQLIDAVGPKRILFGTDFPVFRMRGARIVENDFYYNLIPKGLYGDVSDEPHMRELEDEAAEKLTFMIYEEIAAFKSASEKTGLSKEDIGDVFYNNASKIFI